MKTNFHTHTQRCLHAYGSERDYVREAESSGLEILGFSDHAPFPDKDYGHRMKYDELSDYINEIDRLSVEYKEKIHLYKGLEIEYHPQYNSYYKKLFTEYKIDYLALGEHTYSVSENEMKNIFFAETTKDYIEYARNIEEAVETGFFAFVAHPDIMFINEAAWDVNCDKACSIILSAAEKYDIPLEFNANGIRRGQRYYSDGMRYPYPHEKFWGHLRGSKQKVLIGSDCHTPEQIRDNAVIIAEHMCSKMDLNVIETIF